jgi:hypothetical protein
MKNKSHSSFLHLCKLVAHCKECSRFRKNASVHSSDCVEPLYRGVESGVDAATYVHTWKKSRALATDFLPTVCETSALITT